MGETMRTTTGARRAPLRYRAWLRVLTSFVGAALVSGALWSLYLFFVTVRTAVAQTSLPIVSSTGQIRDDVPVPVALPGQDLADLAARSERLNILILGIDKRENETGPFRSDTMILVSVDLVGKSASMLSIPRDLWVTIPGFGENRVSAAHHYGDLRDYPGGGIALAKRTVQYNLGVPVHRAVRVSFTAFEQLIDAIDGITVDVPRRIYDTTYPDNNYGYMTVDIPAGIQHMDGVTALQYARSRHGNSDYDRMARQQQVILAARDRVLSLDFPISRIPDMLELVGESLYTDIPLRDLLTLAELAKDIRREDIRFGLIDSSMTYSRVLESGAMVEVADWTKVRNLVRELFPASGLEDESPDLVRARLASEGARIVLQNGSLVTNLAADAADALRADGFNVVRYDNADRFDYGETQIVDRTGNEFTAQALAEWLKVDLTQIQRVKEPEGSDVDIVVILGRDYAQRVAQE